MKGEVFYTGSQVRCACAEMINQAQGQLPSNKFGGYKKTMIDFGMNLLPILYSYDEQLAVVVPKPIGTITLGALRRAVLRTQRRQLHPVGSPTLQIQEKSDQSDPVYHVEGTRVLAPRPRNLTRPARAGVRQALCDIRHNLELGDLPLDLGSRDVHPITSVTIPDPVTARRIELESYLRIELGINI
jgi:hypothetical protein